MSNRLINNMISYVILNISFTASRDDGWALVNEDGSVLNSGLSLTLDGLQYIDEGALIRFLSAPSKYLGNQLNSYGQRFSIQVSPAFDSRYHQLHMTTIGFFVP